LFKAKKGENFNHRCPQEMPLGCIHLSISRMEASRPKDRAASRKGSLAFLYSSPQPVSKDGLARSKPVKFEPDAGIGQKGAFFKVL